jgi:signal transduction histidine kinase
MGWQQSPFVYPALVASLLAVGVVARAGLSLRRRPTNATLWTFVALAGGIAIWTGTEAVAFARTEFATKLLVYRVGHLGVVTVLAAWLLFALAYTGRERWLRPTPIAVLLVIPAVALAIAWTDPYPLAIADAYIVTDGPFRYLFVEVGPAIWVLRAYGYVMADVGSLLVVALVLRAATPYRGQTALLVGAALLPFLGEVASTLGVLPDDHLNYAALLTSISVIAFAVAIFRYRLLDLLPVARNRVFESMDDGIVVTDDRGRIVDTNARARQLLDLDGSAVGTQAATVVPQFRTVTADDTSVIETTLAGGRIVELSGTALTRRSSTHGLIVTIRDVTTERRNERRLDRQRRRLDQLARTVSHDLENPLDMGRKWVSLLRDALDDDSIDEELLETGLDELEHANARIDAIVDDLVVLTDAERRTLDTEPLELADLAHLAWHVVDDDALSLVVESSKTIEGDRTKSLRLFENLFQNVVEHADGAETVRVGTGPDGFYVEDDGSGIDADDEDEILEGGYSSKSDGTGLGLAVVRTVAEVHGWTVRITPRTGGGTRFEFVEDDLQPTTTDVDLPAE